VLAPVTVTAPAPSFVKLPPELVRFEARVTFWPFVSILYCWLAALENRAE